MAYTYEQFESAASKAGLLGKFDRQDLTITQQNPEYGISMLQLMKNRSGAKTLEQRLLADEAVRQLRQTYGSYGTGGRVPEYADEVVQQTDNYYAGQNAYRRALAEAEGYGGTSYDSKVGSIYARQGALERQRAQADALATASARTGGTASSYAIRAAQEAAGAQDAQVDDAILDLRRNAYQQALSAAKKGNGDKKQEGSVTDPPEDTTVTKRVTPKKTEHADNFAQSIDGDIALQKKMGATDEQIRNRLLDKFSEDNYFSMFTEEEMMWLLQERFKQYGLLEEG